LGRYDGAERYGFRSAGTPGLDIGGDGHGCNEVAGRFDVKELKFGSGNTVEMLSIAFEQRCGPRGSALRGEVRLNPFITVTAPAARSVVIGEPMTFTISATDDINGRAIHLSGLDLPAGAIFTDNGDNTGSFSWTPGEEQSGTFDVTFEGRSDSGRIAIAVTRIEAGEEGEVEGSDLGFAGDLFPHHAGATWTYRIGTSLHKITLSVLAEKKLINGVQTSIFRDDDNYREYYTADDEGLRWHGIRWPNGRSMTFEPPLRLTNGVVRVGDLIESDGIVRLTGSVRGHPVSAVVRYRARMSAGAATDITAPAGTFEVARVGGDLEIGGAATQIWFYLASGVGVIRSETIEYGDTYALNLLKTNVAPFTIDAVSLPEESAASLTAARSKSIRPVRITRSR
jgi:hypothetical protein